jgi:hypothetical protein
MRVFCMPRSHVLRIHIATKMKPTFVTKEGFIKEIVIVKVISKPFAIINPSGKIKGFNFMPNRHTIGKIANLF